MNMEKDLQNRGEKLYAKLSLSKSFQTGIQEIRTAFKLPAYGFKDIETIVSWHESTFQRMEKRFYKSVDSFLQKQRLPRNVWWQHKIIQNVLALETPLIIRADYYMPFIEMIDNTIHARGNYSELRMYDGISQRELIDFIKSNWKSIKPPHGLGISKNIHGERGPLTNMLMLELGEEAKKKKPGESSSKDMRIAKKIEERTGKLPSLEAVKMRRYRKRNAKR